MNKYRVLILILIVIIGYLIYKDHNMEYFADMSNSSKTPSEETLQEITQEVTQEVLSENYQETPSETLMETNVQEERYIPLSESRELQKPNISKDEPSIIKDKLERIECYKLCLGDTCITENDLKSFVKHGDKFTLKSNMNNNRLRITDPGKNNEPRQAWFTNTNRGPWEVLRIEKCGLEGVEDGHKCWSWGAFGKQVQDTDI